MTMLVEPTNWGASGVTVPAGLPSPRQADQPVPQQIAEFVDLRRAVERACAQPETGREFTQWLRDLVTRLEEPAR